MLIHPPAHCPDAITVTRLAGSDGLRHAEGEEVHETYPLPSVPPSAGSFNFGHSEGLAYEAAAVHDALSRGQTECAEYTADDSVAQIKLLDTIRRKLGVEFPEDKSYHRGSPVMS